MSPEDLARNIAALFTGMNAVHPNDIAYALEGVVTSAPTFSECGLSDYNAGVVLRMRDEDGQSLEFQLTIVRS